MGQQLNYAMVVKMSGQFSEFDAALVSVLGQKRVLAEKESHDLG